MRRIFLIIVAAFGAAASLSLTLESASAQMVGDNPYDPGCNVNVGGNCGRQLDMWNSTWRRLHLPLEPGRGAQGTYLPGRPYVGRFLPQANSAPQRTFGTRMQTYSWSRTVTRTTCTRYAVHTHWVNGVAAYTETLTLPCN